MLSFGILWEVLVTVMTVFMFIGHTDAIAPILGVMFLFHGVGIWTLVRAIKQQRNKARIRNEGKHYKAKVVDYRRNTNEKVNGKPELIYVCRYYDENSMILEVEVYSGKYRLYDSDIPIGCTVEIAVLGLEAQIVKVLGMEHLYGEKELLRADLEKANAVGRREFVVVACPHCGAEVSIANHGTTQCTYCRQLISYDDDSEDILPANMSGTEYMKLRR